MIAIVVSALEMVPKDLEKRLKITGDQRKIPDDSSVKINLNI